MDRRTSEDPTTPREFQPGNASQNTGKQNNVIAMKLDAEFFFQRGVKLLEKNQLNKALQAFRKTVEYEPNNPVNHCNLAGVLSELGDFEGSNEVLLNVLEHIDPEMSECQFYLANNYANMGQYDRAEEYVLKYLDADPDGEFAPDAEEMLDILMDEFGGGQVYERWERERQERERDEAIRDGRHLLEEGHFEAAVQWLEERTNKDPEDMAAFNNLSLAYYYTGRYQQAVETAEHVLSKDPDNIHGLCNLAVFTAHLGPARRLERIVEKLSKVFPLHYDHAMKVATTLGIIGSHEAAFDVFDRLIRFVEQPEPILIHSVAAAAANIGRLHAAAKWWKVLNQLPEMQDVARYYLDAVADAQRRGVKSLKVSYQYDVPLQVKFREMKKRLDTGDVMKWLHDPLFRASLYWGLRHGSSDMQRAVIRTLTMMGDADAERALIVFVERKDISSSLQAAALYALQRMGSREEVNIWRDGQRVSMSVPEVPQEVILSVEGVWTQVWENVENWLNQQGHENLIPEAKRVWIGYLKHMFQRNTSTVGKPEIWEAALVYSVLKRHGVGIRQRDVAEDFHVSVSSVSKATGKLSGFFVTMP